jgi:hypothetical protein
MGMRFEELCVEGEQFGIERLLDPGEINRRVLCPRMVAVDQQRSERKERKKEEVPQLQTLGSANGLHANTMGLFSGETEGIVHELSGT